ncbi:BC1872 family protein [Brevibacillus brevis]|uniref:Phage ABA sandwich domain-containing protein n=1 Tax=Brevibacillus brevis TaxID=1393 RepID=A0A517I8L6_BREBE|nr:hypothetical protein [Brevibacillus brevis]QDS35231.1 hypothetical protein FPS98_15145 [Brevibacillus brevis]
MTELQIVLTLATKVMEWKRYEETDFWYGDNGNLFNSSLWNPLQNIADAWQVVEKLRTDGFGVNVFGSGTGFNCEVYEFTSGTSLADIDASTAQEAISNAAYKLVA